MTGTAAGVVAGNIIADKIIGQSDIPSSNQDIVADSNQRPCLYKEQQLLHCTQNETDLRVCEVHRQELLNCNRKQNMQ
ncbi:hypothetical protein KM043_009079 [Ampulex compressa]|nr:hypothetical protein KM043_009079 [Ampulex compressa]